MKYKDTILYSDTDSLYTSEPIDPEFITDKLGHISSIPRPSATLPRFIDSKFHKRRFKFNFDHIQNKFYFLYKQKNIHLDMNIIPSSVI